MAYSTIAYARGRPTHWDNLTIVHYDRDFNEVAEAIRMGVSEEQVTSPSNHRCSSSLAATGRSVCVCVFRLRPR